MDLRGAITEANRKWWTLGAVAAVVIRGRPKHELLAHGGPELPRPAVAL
jgi:hypothetical protein